MKIIRRIDDLGRVVIPKEVRNILNIKEGDPLEIEVANGKIVINTMSSYCVFCHSETDKNDVFSGKLCNKCLVAIKKGEYAKCCL